MDIHPAPYRQEMRLWRISTLKLFTYLRWSHNKKFAINGFNFYIFVSVVLWSPRLSEVSVYSKLTTVSLAMDGCGLWLYSFEKETKQEREIERKKEICFLTQTMTKVKFKETASIESLSYHRYDLNARSKFRSFPSVTGFPHF